MTNIHEQDRECNFTELCYQVGNYELFFKLFFGYKELASERMHISVKFEVKKKWNILTWYAHGKTFSTKLFSSA